MFGQNKSGVRASSQEYARFMTFGASLLKRSEKLSELIGELEAETTEKEQDQNRVKKPLGLVLVSTFSKHFGL